jgi:hypothetical protein
MLRAAPDVHLAFTEDDEKMLAKMRQIDEKMLPIVLRHTYLQNRAPHDSESGDDDNEWDQVWNKIENEPIKGVDISFRQFRTDYPHAILFIPLWLWSSLAALALLDVYVPILAWLSYRSSAGHEATVAIVALDVLACFALALSVFVLRAYGGSEIQMLAPSRDLLVASGVSDESLLNEVDEYRGTSVRPRGVRLGPKYLSELRNFVMKALVIDVMFRATAIFGLVAVSFVVGSAMSGEWEVLRTTYSSMLIVLAWALLGLVCGFYLAALVVEDPRSLMTPMLAGAISAGVPLLGQYLVTGSLGDNPGAVVVAVLIGLFTVAGTVTGDLVKRSLERKERMAPNSAL